MHGFRDPLGFRGSQGPIEILGKMGLEGPTLPQGAMGIQQSTLNPGTQRASWNQRFKGLPWLQRPVGLQEILLRIPGPIGILEQMGL